jgi:pyruvate ferredoxin oxidoreductase alpha subunit
MARDMLTGNGAAAWAARLAQVDYVPAFPITPQTEIIETIARWTQTGAMEARLVTMDSEHSMLAAAASAAATGVRVFTATSSQGLVYGLEMLYVTAGLRAPLVLVNVSRALSHPITLEPDHNDVLSARDTGFLQIHAETCQEVLDSILWAYRLAEDPQVRLPVIVNLDGFYLSFTREIVELPELRAVKRFLPAYEPSDASLGKNPHLSLGVAVLDPSQYSFYKYQAHRASENALVLHSKLAPEFAEIFGRQYATVEEYFLDDADYVIVMINSFASMGKAEVRRLREMYHVRIGLLRPRLLRPFPHHDIQRALAGRKAVAVIDQNISVGKGGILYNEIASALYGLPERPPLLLSFIGGLGGRRFRPEDFNFILHRLQHFPEEPGQMSQSNLLFTPREWLEVQQAIQTAGDQ